MLKRIREFDLKKAGYGGRTESLTVAQELSVSSIIITAINMLSVLVATQIIPIKLNRFVGIAFSIFLILTLSLTFIGFCFDIRIAFEKRW